MDNTHITILSPSEFPGNAGDTANFSEMIDQFLLEGLKVYLICPKNTKRVDPEFENSDKNLKVIRINCRPPRLNELDGKVRLGTYLQFLWFLIIGTITVLRVIRSKKVKKIYVRHNILTMHLSLLFKILGIKTLADGEVISDMLSDLMNPVILKLFSYYERNILKYYTYFKVSTPSHKKVLEKNGIPSDKIVIIPVSINTDKIPKFNVENIPENTFGYFGGLESWQGVDILIKSFKLLLKKLPGSLLYIIGDGPLSNDLKESVELDNISSNVIFVGKINRHRLWYDYFGKFRITVIPRQKLNNSIDTILPIKLVESLASSKPIIAIDIPVMREIQGNPLLLVESGNPQLLAESMHSLTMDLKEMNNRSQLSYKASKNYDIKENIKRLILILSY